ncbi:MAG TPA: hypothetical protein ENI88_07910 [Desulfobulbus sp.]|nr:hypothetical protein [Desulfobulbus sp.]
MGKVHEVLTKISQVINTIADWFLIIAGLVLICWSLLSVDVTEAKYLLIGAGVLLSGSGIWFRRLSLKKRKQGKVTK